MGTAQQLFLNAFTVDTETLSLHRGSPITEVGVYDWNKKQVIEYLLKPRAAYVEGNANQDITKLASSVMDKHTAQGFKDWPEALRAIVALQIKKDVSAVASDEQLKIAIGQVSDFLHSALYGGKEPAYPYLLGQTESSTATALRQARFAREGVGFRTQADVRIEDLLRPGGLFPRAHAGATQGTTIWASNIGFESKQFGAQLGAMGEDAVKAFKGQMETSSAYADPLYVTGKEVNQARTAAQLTGDWTGVYKAYKANIPKVGEVAARDQIDVVRAVQSYGKKLGIISNTNEHLGLSVDLQYRLLGSAEPDAGVARSRMMEAEAHRAAEDAAISTNYALRKSIQHAETLEAVHDRTPQGLRYLEEAKAGHGPFFEASKYLRNTEVAAGMTSRKSALQRLERAQLDLMAEGQTWQFTGYRGVQQMDQQTPTGASEKVARARPARTGYDNMDEVIGRLKRTGEYGSVDLDAEWQAMRQHAGSAETLSSYVSQQNKDTVANFFSKNEKTLLEMSPGGQIRHVNSIYGERTAKTMAEDVARVAPRMSKMMLAGAAGIGVLGGLWGMAMGGGRGPGAPRDQSIMTMNYGEWEASHPVGLADQGMSHQTRAQNTDFGSPYQGPATSASVLMNQQLLGAREQWSRQQYQVEFFDDQQGIFSANGVMSYLRRSSVSFSRSDRNLEIGELPGLKNRRGMKVLDANPRDWKISVDDADTLTVQRRGLASSVSRFFGLNREDYTFRLEGIDSTETAHGSDSYHAPQPFADQATKALQAMYAGRTLQIAYDPKNMTYGRNVGVVYSDGKNLNLEEVRRGIAEHLPYGKRKNAHVDWDAMKMAQEKAVASNRGMWATPWAQVYNEFSQNSGTQITFDTFAKTSKMANNLGTMQLLTEMEHAQAQGFVSSDAIARAGAIGKSWDMRGDSVRPFTALGRTQTRHNGHMSQLLADNSRFMSTQGTNENPYRTSHNSGTGKLNGYLALDTMGSNTSPWGRRTLDAYDRYGERGDTKANQKKKMAAMQRQVNQSFGVSPIGHNRM